MIRTAKEHLFKMWSTHYVVTVNPFGITTSILTADPKEVIRQWKAISIAGHQEGTAGTPASSLASISRPIAMGYLMPSSRNNRTSPYGHDR
jgi:hypothetical protein